MILISKWWGVNFVKKILVTIFALYFGFLKIIVVQIAGANKNERINEKEKEKANGKEKEGD